MKTIVTFAMFALIATSANAQRAKAVDPVKNPEEYVHSAMLDLKTPPNSDCRRNDDTSAANYLACNAQGMKDVGMQLQKKLDSFPYGSPEVEGINQIAQATYWPIINNSNLLVAYYIQEMEKHHKTDSAVYKTLRETANSTFFSGTNPVECPEDLLMYANIFQRMASELRAAGVTAPVKSYRK